MEYILLEINAHKTKLMNLINNLINTQLINEEIFINNEIKKESELLISLLNIKQKTLMNPNNINFNPLMNQPNPMLMIKPPINLNQMPPQAVSNNFKNNNMDDARFINVKFKKGSGEDYVLYCNPYEKNSEVIKKYREKANDYSENLFLFNSKDLNPSSTLFESGIVNYSLITVVKVLDLKGSKLR